MTEKIATTNSTEKLGRNTAGDKAFTKKEITANLKKFNSKKAPGEDGLTSKILRKAFQFLFCLSHKYTTRV
jgi:hypothetical protein